MPHDPNYIFVTKQLATTYDYLAPDSSEIRLLPWVRGGNFSHCTLPCGSVSQAVFHRYVEELWYCISGKGQLFRKHGDCEQIIDLLPGTSITIPTGMIFQFRALGDQPLCILIATMPAWPGADEAVPTDGYWERSVE